MTLTLYNYIINYNYISNNKYIVVYTIFFLHFMARDLKDDPLVQKIQKGKT